MRSLTLRQVQGVDFKSCSNPSSSVSKVAVDPESGAVYVTVESISEGALEVKVDVIQVDQLANGFPTYEVLGSVQSRLAPFELPQDAPQVVDLHFFPDDQTLTIIMAGGDIITVQLEQQRQGLQSIEVIGSVDGGVKAAAWSPDDEQLVYIDEVDGMSNLVCMTRTFDIISESPLRSEEFGQDDFINVGWGSKTTQFHGSLGKAAAQASTAASSLAHSTDNGLPHISFRGDAAFFAVSSLDPYQPSPSLTTNTPSPARRQIRIFSRDASSGFAPRLSATSEALPGLEAPISWRPSGNVLSSLIRYGYEGGGQGKPGRWDVAMLERNGLRHGGFELREEMETWAEGKVKGMSWNATSEVLAIWIERVHQDIIQLWTMKNYHYYLKQEVSSHRPNESRFKGFRWHPEQPMELYIFGSDYVQFRAFAWDTYASRLPIPVDTATVAVVDGTRLLLTPFRTQNTPPPMSSYHIDLPSTPVHVSMSQNSDTIAILFPSGTIQTWDLNTRIPDAKAGSRVRGGGKVADPKLRWEALVDLTVAKQLVLNEVGEVGVLSWDEGKCFLSMISDQGKQTGKNELSATTELLLCAPTTGWLGLDKDGVVISPQLPSFTLDLCPRVQSAAISHEANLIIALSESGKLFISSLTPGYQSITMGNGVTSFTLTPDFLIWTTSTQSSSYAPLPIVAMLANGEDLGSSGLDEWETRRIERGALAVIACPSSMSLVLQMPRGNLETIYPRPLVLAVVRRDVIAGEYRSAFTTCRKHRLDVNVIYDLAPEAFMQNLTKVIEQIPEVDYLNLFLSSLSPDDSSKVLYQDLARDSTKCVPSDKINAICDALRAKLEAKGLVDYVETILTSHVCKSPPDYESGLNILLRLQVDHAEVVEDAIKYIIFLSDVNKLFDVALGMYNFQLVLMIAQYSQKDPKEYLPFLRELRSLDIHEQRFRIDDHLGRREKALKNLHAAGSSRFEDAASYLSRYELFDEAFALYKDDEKHIKTIYGLYADYLYDRREFMNAALSYLLAGNNDKALKSFEKAHAWRELFTLAKKQKLSAQVIREICERVTDHLTSRGQGLEASRILVDYADDVDGAVDVLCNSAEFSEAIRLASLHERNDLVESTIHPSLEDAHEALTEVFEEMDGQLKKEMNRLMELHEIRKTDPVDKEPELENVDVATNATTVMTAFTRYTVAPTTVMSQSTRITGQTARSKHKPSRKRQAGRKGTVDEYDYLVASIGRLIIRADEKSADAIPLLGHLILASSHHMDLARALQTTIITFRDKLEAAIEQAWADRALILDAAEESGGMGFGGEISKAREVVRPSVGAWKGLGALLA